MAQTIIFLILGLLLLVWGAEWLVRGASKLARAVGISPLAIGLTIVAYGTSTPELVVNIGSVLTGKTDIALGNIVGSNIFNALFILGICGLIAPLRVEVKLIKWDVPIMIAVSVFLYLLCLDHNLSALEGIVLFIGVILYTWFCFAFSKKESKNAPQEYEKEFGGKPSELRQPRQIIINIALITSGLAILVIGSKWLVNSSIELARYFGVSELVIGLTIVAAGTSLPEVATSMVATLRGERDIAIGNVIGSNIYNILAILGVTGILAGRFGFAINPNSMKLDIPFMIFTSILCYPIFKSRSTISRKEGTLFLLLYIGYTLYLINSSH